MTPRGVCFPAPRPSWPGNRQNVKSPIISPNLESGIPFDRSAHRPSVSHRKRASLALPSKPVLRPVQLDSPIISARELISIYTY